MKYEICYLVGESNEPKLDGIKAEIEKIVTQSGGNFYGIETIDRRKLAYKVEKDLRGIYLTRRFEIPEMEQLEESPIQEITKKLNLFADIHRFLVIKADKLPELKQREIPVKTERAERRFDRGRSSSPSSFRRAATPRVEEKKPEIKEEAKPEDEAKKEESIDKKLDEILNI